MEEYGKLTGPSILYCACVHGGGRRQLENFHLDFASILEHQCVSLCTCMHMYLFSLAMGKILLALL